MESIVAKNLIVSFILFTCMHACVWWATNAQFMGESLKNRSLEISLALSIPITLFAYFAARYSYGALGESLWSIRFIGFGTSYFIFPVFTWFFFGETMFTWKTIICIFLSFIIVAIQVFWPS